MITIKDKKHYVLIKNYFNKNHALAWRRISGRPFVGCCSYLLHKYNPKDYQEFLDRYLEDYETETYMWDTGKGDMHRGRSEAQLMNLAEIYYNSIDDDNVTIEMCLDDIINHVIIETFDGHIVERTIREKLSGNNDFFTVETEDDLDALFGIDIVISKKSDPNYLRYLQVKPNTFFIGNNNESLKRDRANAFKKEAEFKTFLENNGRENEFRNIEYMIYNKDSYEFGNIEFLNENRTGKNKFNLSELISTDGTSNIYWKNYTYKKF